MICGPGSPLGRYLLFIGDAGATPIGLEGAPS